MKQELEKNKDIIVTKGSNIVKLDDKKIYLDVIIWDENVSREYVENHIAK